MAVYKLRDGEFGVGEHQSRRGKSRKNEKWKNGRLIISAPLEIRVAEIIKFIEDYRLQLRQLNRPQKQYNKGDKFVCFKHTIEILEHNGKKGTLGYGGTDDKLYVSVHKDADFANDTLNNTISKCMTKLMTDRAESILIPFAQDIATSLSVKVSRFEIGRGLRKLGHCTPKKIIQLSHNLMFLDEELVRYIVHHELAHIAEMNHSERFHALCNLYCNGKERYLERRLKTFNWPIRR